MIKTNTDYKNEKINLKKNTINKNIQTKYKNYYLGELIKKDGTYYNARDRKKFYSEYDSKNKHLCPGHYFGYRYIIENYTKPGDIVTDPCAGSGTALCESILLDRNSLGAEIEFYKISLENLKHFSKDIVTKKYVTFSLFSGDAKDAKTDIERFLNGRKINLIVTGPPYIGKRDVPERKNIKTKKDSTFEYKNTKGIAYSKPGLYFYNLKQIYDLWSEYLEIGGHLVFIIKDYMEDKKVYRLHEKITDMMINTGKFEMKGLIVHKHYPPTLNMSTYNKKYPDAEKVPEYQMITILKKVRE